MAISNTLVIKIILAAVCLLFVWFGLGELFTGITDAARLLLVGAVGFGLASIILP